jgi:hypothetical protein
VARHNYGTDIELKRPDRESAVRAEMASYRELFTCRKGAAGMAALKAHLNLRSCARARSYGRVVLPIIHFMRELF